MDISSNHSNSCIECRGMLAATAGAIVAVGTAVEWDTLCGTTRATVTCVDDFRVTLAHADGAFFAVEPTRFQTLADAVSFLRPPHWCLGGQLLAAGGHS